MDVSESSYEHSYDGGMSALPERVEVRVRPERRRRWSSAAKLAIVRETLAPSATAQAVADRHGIGTGLIYCLYAKRLELPKARFVWPQTDSGAVTLTAAQISMLLEGIDWRMPAWTARPEVAV